MSKYDCKIILCGPATGKTFLANHDNRFVDIDGMRAKYKYNIENLSYEEFEKGKSNRGIVVNNDSMNYSIKLLKNTINSGKVALISYHKELLEYIINNKIDYCLVYADISLRKEYIKRMKNRGNNEKFIDDMTNENSWKKFYKANENDTKPKYKVKLKKGQYISDIADLFF